MGEIDNSSNCSEVSYNSDVDLSNLSSVSGFSLYKNEFIQLKHSIDPDKFIDNVASDRASTPKAHDIHFECNKQISSLMKQVQDVLDDNKRHKADLYNIEKKLELSFYSKIENLVRSKNQLEVQLDAANKQIERLLVDYTAKDNTSELQIKILNIEKENHLLNNRNSFNQSEIAKLKAVNNELELLNNHLNSELCNYKSLNDTNKVCIEKLKQKISQQHVEHQKIVQKDNKLSNLVVELQNELSQNKKSENWFREQLHANQKQKQTLLDKNLQHKKVITAQDDKIHQLNVEITSWKSKYDHSHLDMIKERENFLKRINEIENRILRNTNNDPRKTELDLDIERLNKEYQVTIRELSDEIKHIKDNVFHYEQDIHKVNKENAEITAQCIKLQKLLKHKEDSIELLEKQMKDSSDKLIDVQNIVVSLNKDLLLSQEEFAKLKIEVSVRNEEKQVIENTIFTVREQFNKLKLSYEKLKSELQVKSKHIMQLESEKQELFMNNNWKVCELEKTKEKDIIIDSLKHSLEQVKSEKNELIKNHNQSVKTYEDTILDIHKEVERYRDLVKSNENKYLDIITDLTKKMEKHETSLLNYKMTISDYQNEVNSLKLFLSDLQKTLKDLESKSESLKQEIHKRDTKIMQMDREFLSLERIFNEKLDEVVREKSNISCENESLKQNLGKMFSDNSKFMLGDDVGEIGIENIIKLLHQVYNINKESFLTSTNGDSASSDCLNLILNSIAATSKHVDDVSDVKDKEAVLKGGPSSNEASLSNGGSAEPVKLANEKCALFEDKTQTSSHTEPLVVDAPLETEEIKKLQALLHVKDLEKKEMQKRHERNNRTLLRKLKEHMKGRNLAENQIAQLRKLFDASSEENNTLKLQLSSKAGEVMSLNERVECQSLMINKLKQTNLSLEKMIMEKSICETCLDYNILVQQLEQIKNSLECYQNNYEEIKQELNVKETLIDDLRKEIQLISTDKLKILHQLEYQKKESLELIGELNTVKSCLETEREKVKEFNIKIDAANYDSEQKEFKIEKLSHLINQYEDDIKYLNEEIECSNRDSQQKQDEIKQLVIMKEHQEKELTNIELSTQKLISTLNSELQSALDELESIRNEKFFLQRLCSDLKAALKANLNYNKILKEQVANLSKEPDFSSLPNTLPCFSPSNKYDEDYINNLLAQTKTIAVPFDDLQCCLDSLKREVLSLHSQVVEKDRWSKNNFTDHEENI